MTYNDFRNIWFSALDYTDDQRDLYRNERGWQTWMDEFGDDTAAIIYALDTIYDMAHMGCKGIRAVTGMTQQAFGDAYGVPRRSVQNWELQTRDVPLYTLMTLGYAVLSDSIPKLKLGEE